MAARDDSVVRGSLIACIIFLVLSLALNFFLWRTADIAADEAETAKRSAADANGELRTFKTQADMMRSMLGFGGLTEAEFKQMSESVSGDPVMSQIESQFVKDMSFFGDNVPDEDKNYHKLPEYLVTSLRSRNEQYSNAREEQERIKREADAAVAKQKEIADTAKQGQVDAEKELDKATTLFAEDRKRMNQEKGEARDMQTKIALEFQSFQKQAGERERGHVRRGEQLAGTIETQRLELQRLRADRFETSQGKIGYVYSGGNVVTINLGKADSLREGVTFGVIDGTAIRQHEADVKATIQVTKVHGAHSAQARVVARPDIRTPIIPGDVVYSPFWAPGRKVRIALAGAIDTDGDGRADNDEIKGMIAAAGAEVVAEVAPDGTETGKLDASVRFLVVGEDPEITDRTDLDVADARAATIAQLGNIKARATELGLTIIPAWKLENYLRIMDDSITTPLGSAARGEDFAVEQRPPGNSRLPSNLPKTFTEQVKGTQRALGNKILPP